MTNGVGIHNINDNATRCDADDDDDGVVLKLCMNNRCHNELTMPFSQLLLVFLKVSDNILQSGSWWCQTLWNILIDFVTVPILSHEADLIRISILPLVITHILMILISVSEQQEEQYQYSYRDNNNDDSSIINWFKSDKETISIMENNYNNDDGEQKFYTLIDCCWWLCIFGCSLVMAILFMECIMDYSSTRGLHSNHRRHHGRHPPQESFSCSRAMLVASLFSLQAVLLPIFMLVIAVMTYFYLSREQGQQIYITFR